MIVFDFEVFKHDWMVAWIDTKTRKTHYIVNNAEKLAKMYDYYSNRVWVGYNCKGYDQYILKAILCGLNPYGVSKWIVEDDKPGYEYSQQFRKYPVMTFDIIYYFNEGTSLKQLEAYMGKNIKETPVPFDIDRHLTRAEIDDVLSYCKHDVENTLEAFIEKGHEYESHIGLIREFALPGYYISKTRAQLSAEILGAVPRKYDDEFDIEFAPTLKLGRYEYLKDKFQKWAKTKNYKLLDIREDIGGVPHKFGVGGLHGALPKYVGDGDFLMADVSSYYPALMIEYGWLSRNVRDPKKYRQIRDERLEMKKRKDPRQQPRKIVLNGTFGASKQRFNKLYDPRQANNICINGQLFLVDLIDKVEDYCQLIQSNTDGILMRLYDPADRDKIIAICEEWSKRTRMDLEYDDVGKVVQRDVNNYALRFSNGYIKRIGYLKPQNKLDFDTPIIKKAVMEFLMNGVPVEKTILKENSLLMFQKVTKIGKSYDYMLKEHFGGKPYHFEWYTYKTRSKNKVKYKEETLTTLDIRGTILNEKVIRVFASKDPNDGTLWKKKGDKPNLDKTAGTPDHCRIENGDIRSTEVPDWLDKQWYIDQARDQIAKFY